MTGSAVVAYEAASLTERREYAQTLAAAGDLIPKGLWSTPTTGADGRMIPAAPSPGKVLLVIETGAMLGLHPAAALQSINVVEGRATLSAQLIAALIRKAGHKLSIHKTGTIAGGDYSVTAVGVRADSGEEFSATWDLHRAHRAGLIDSYKRNSDGVWEVRARSAKGGIKPWEAYAEVMPVWRAISEVSREGFSDVTYGLYSNEELTDGAPSLPVADAPEAAPSEDWPAAIAAATTRTELDAVADRMKAAGEVTDKLKAAWMARAGVLAREENTVDAEVVTDEPTSDPAPDAEAPADQPQTELSEAAEYEARAAAEYEAAVARGEVQP